MKCYVLHCISAIFKIKISDFHVDLFIYLFVCPATLFNLFISINRIRDVNLIYSMFQKYLFEIKFSQCNINHLPVQIIMVQMLCREYSKISDFLTLKSVNHFYIALFIYLFVCPATLFSLFISINIIRDVNLIYTRLCSKNIYAKYKLFNLILNTFPLELL